MVLTASVLAESLVLRARAGTVDIDRFRTLIRQLSGPARPIDEDIAVAAASLRATHRSLRLPDALVIATGVVDNADAILTADKRWLGIHDRVQLVSDAGPS
jgi:PIN domain nuclease of toxin-antitoxin system